MAELVALIEENLVRQYWPREDYVLTRRYSGLHRKPDSCKGSFVYGRLYSATGRWPGDSPNRSSPKRAAGTGGFVRRHTSPLRDAHESPGVRNRAPCKTPEPVHSDVSRQCSW